ncbi:MAG TPA: hypothetical protein DCQ31_02440, partial [Bacteroidales bacterium]|nr:hypothetical protein [Bacteroidales bacterium]
MEKFYLTKNLFSTVVYNAIRKVGNANFHVFMALWIAILLVSSCKPSHEQAANVFADTVLFEILKAQDSRNTNDLLPFLASENVLYRKQAALAFASVQDSAALEKLYNLVSTETDSIVCAAAAYAIGQTKAKSSEDFLMAQIETKTNKFVQTYLLEALGKSGTIKGLDFVSNPENIVKIANNEGVAKCIYRYMLQGTSNKQSVVSMLTMLESESGYAAKLFAAHYFSRNRTADLTEHTDRLIKIIENEKNEHVRMALVQSLSFAKSEKVFKFLKQLIETTGTDYRTVVNALSAIAFQTEFEPESVLLNVLNHANVNVGIRAAELLSTKGQAKFAENALDVIQQNKLNYRVKALLFKFYVKNSESPSEINQKIIEEYNASTENYYKAALLSALGECVLNYEFIASELISASPFVIKTAAADAFAAIRANTKFMNKIQQQTDIETKFNDYVKVAFNLHDMAVTGILAGMLRQPEFNYKEVFKDFSFLQTALDACKLPRDIETYNELLKTINYFKGVETPANMPNVANNPLDKALIQSISSKAKVEITTDKGIIIIQLFVNESPGSVSNFVRLINEGFFVESRIHRVVPNFVAQDGCPRGDGWGSPEYSIRSEFG